MLDTHCSVGTPGALGTLTKLATLVPTDGLTVVGQPVQAQAGIARLIMHGSISLLANTIAEHQIVTQDCIDPINGEYTSLGTGSLKNLFTKFTNILYKTGARNILQTTNTAQTATSIAITMDWYDSGQKIGNTTAGDYFLENLVAVPQTLGADVAIAWKTTPYAPANPIPAGTYALLGFLASKMTQGHVIRFSHADFGWPLPGIPCVDNVIATMPEQGMLDKIFTNPGYQFIEFSKLTGKPCCPTFKVGVASTGLNIQSIAPAATDTPVITPYLAKIG